MDRKTVLAFVLIALIMFFWQYYLQLVAPPVEEGPETYYPMDTTQIVKKEKRFTEKKVLDIPLSEKIGDMEAQSKLYKNKIEKEEKLIYVRTDLYEAVFSTKGGSLIEWKLNKFMKGYDTPVSLIPRDHAGNLSLRFTDSEGNQVSTENWEFEYEGNSFIELSPEHKEEKLTFVVDLGKGKQITKQLTFKNDKYSFDMTVVFEGMTNNIVDHQYELVWTSGLESSEENIEDDMKYAKAFALLGDELEEVDPSGEHEKSFQYFDGTTSWVGTRTKYFSVAVIPQNKKGVGAGLGGYDRSGIKTCELSLVMAFSENESHSDQYTVFLGPLDFEVVQSFGVDLEKMMDFGWTLIRPISKLVLRSFKFSHQYISNYGLLIILFVIVVKTFFHPLTHKSYQSMKKMQKVQPLMKELQAKYKDKPQKLQKEMMKLYKEHGVNPLGGCLPMLVQMPVFFALYPIFYSTIEFRRAYFIGWINDLSAPDTIAVLKTGLPFIGDFHVNPLPIIMTAFTFIQQKITPMAGGGGSAGQQKMMMYFMPFIFFFIFNSFPSGLVLYWTIFNILSVAQQYFAQTNND